MTESKINKFQNSMRQESGFQLQLLAQEEMEGTESNETENKGTWENFY